jgi:hypothetical protein
MNISKSDVAVYQEVTWLATPGPRTPSRGMILRATRHGSARTLDHYLRAILYFAMCNKPAAQKFCIGRIQDRAGNGQARGGKQVSYTPRYLTKV